VHPAREGWNDPEGRDTQKNRGENLSSPSQRFLEEIEKNLHLSGAAVFEASSS